MKKTIFMACLSIAVSGQLKSQVFINTTGTTNNTDPTYRVGSVAIGKNTAATEMLDVNGNIVLPFGNFLGTSNTTYKKLFQTGWEATNGDYLSFYTAGASSSNQYEKMRISTNGNVGIGTAWYPEARLTVFESQALTSGAGDFKLITSLSGNTGGNNFKQNTWLHRDNSALGNWSDVRLMDGISIDNSFADLQSISGQRPKTWWERDPYDDQQYWGNDANIYMQLDKGRLGINRTTPSARLDIAETDNNYITLLARDYHTQDGLYCIMASVSRDLTKAFTVGNNVGGVYREPFVVLGNGQTQIGIKKSTAHANAMLMVDGKVVCKDLYVTATSDWPDFVFDANYKLANLYDVRDYYEKNKHLPNVPTACEIEEKGINMSEISNIQMQKIEELTLYIVQLKTELDALKKEVTNKK